jgi:hypothetical protein
MKGFNDQPSVYNVLFGAFGLASFKSEKAMYITMKNKKDFLLY